MHKNLHGSPLIGLAASAQSGKTTVADYLVGGYGYSHVSFAGPIRAFVAGLCGVNLFELETSAVKETVIPWIGKSPRQMMQTLGTEWGRTLVHEDFWVRRAMAEVARLAAAGQPAVISDVRFDNEAQAIRAAGGTIVHLVRPAAPRVVAHISEKGVSRLVSDYLIVNDGSLWDLREDLAEIVVKCRHKAGAI